MSIYFYVNSNAQPNGDHEVHRSDCSWLPSAENRVYLGCFSTSREAVNAARKYYRQVDGRNGPPRIRAGHFLRGGKC